MEPDFESMNETDVREVIVRPLLSRFGYSHGTQANIRTEVPLRYERAFLGRKNPKKDPPLSGRADYICEAISYGRWTVEVKAPHVELSRDDVEQAHTYSAHPEIAAVYFLITNGRNYQLYATAQLDRPLLAWSYNETDEHFLTLFNILSYEAIKKRTSTLQPDVQRPLGPGLNSRVRLLAGEVVYGEHRSNHPLFKVDALKGSIGTVTGGFVQRTEDGRLHATVNFRSAYHQQFGDLHRLLGFDRFDFFCADPVIGTTVEGPSVFQNVVSGRIDPPIRFCLMPGLPENIVPLGFDFQVFTAAAGFVEGERFNGIADYEYRYRLFAGTDASSEWKMLLQSVPSVAEITGGGEFSILLG